jgi:hypothetical protein
MTDNQQRAAQVIPNAMRLYYPDVIDEVAAALDAAEVRGYQAGEARGRAEVAAKVRRAIESAPVMRFDNDYPVKALPVAQLLDLPIWGDAEMLAACSGCSMPDSRHWDTCPNRHDGRPSR